MARLPNNSRRDAESAAREPFGLDDIDRGILEVLQSDCKTSLAQIGERVGLSAPSVIERIRKLEEGGVIAGYHAVLDGRRIGLDVTAFIGVTLNYPKRMGSFERAVEALGEVLECHHVTGDHSLLLKVKTKNTATLELLLGRLRAIEGVDRTHTMIVLSTHSERVTVPVPGAALPSGKGGGRK